MAHIGKPGPYAFRRDFNLNVDNNTFGFFRRVLAKFNNLPPGVANVLNGVTFDCGPDTYPQIPELSWESEFTGFIPAIAKLRLFVQINNGRNYDRFLELSIKNVGIILAQHRGRANFDLAPGWSQIAPWVTDFYDPAYFDNEPFNTDITIFNKRWDDGPPH